jgi:hypothetical protein
MPTRLEGGETMAGLFSIAPGDREVVDFPLPLASKPQGVRVMERGQTSAECPGVGADGEHPQAAPGWLCLFVRDAGFVEWDVELSKYGTATYCGSPGSPVPFLHVEGIGYGKPALPADDPWWDSAGFTFEDYCTESYKHRDAVPGSYDPVTRDGLSRFGFDLRLTQGCCGDAHGFSGLWATTAP